MFLVADKGRPAAGQPEIEPGQASRIALPGGKWRKFPNSWISHHGEACCEIAHQWLIAYDFSQLGGGDVLAGPRWIHEHSAWGPTVWPIHWCQAVDAKTVDCGVHAALSHEVFAARGVTAFRAQFVQRYPTHTAAGWQQRWRQGGASDHWIDSELIYHEGNAVQAEEGRIKLWDGSAGCWITPRDDVGYGGITALRIEAKDWLGSDTFEWGGRAIPPNRWVAI
jgi:hypothetical protein